VLGQWENRRAGLAGQQGYGEAMGGVVEIGVVSSAKQHQAKASHAASLKQKIKTCPSL
jgi:hypothetical protein